MKKKFPTWLLILIVAGLLIGSKFVFFPKEESKPRGKGKGGTSVLPVSYHVAAARGFTNTIHTAGEVGAFNQVDLVPEAPGRVVKIRFSEGETVKKGDVLVELNDSDLRAQLEKVRTQLSLSRQKLKRLERLLEVNGVSREEFEMQENEIAAQEADEKFLEAEIAKMNIVAPFPGVVGLRNVSEGAYVSASTPVVSLVQMKPVYIEFSVPEKYHRLFNKGLPVSFSAGNNTDELFKATVYAIEPRVDEATKTIRARARYDGDVPFYPGSFVNVNVKLGESADAIMVPTQCVIPTIEGQKVFVVRKGEAAEAMVTIGARTDRHVQVTEGLAPGDTLVASGLLAIKPGMKLQLLNPID